MLLSGSGAVGAINPALPGAGQAIGANWALLNNGTYNADGGGTGNWVNPATSAIAALYQVKSDVTGGTFTIDPSAGTYVDMSSTRTWVKTGSGVVTFTISFRIKQNGTVVGSQAGITITVP
jgi:hypothetical protein